jgi:outer membrane protein
MTFNSSGCASVDGIFYWRRRGFLISFPAMKNLRYLILATVLFTGLAFSVHAQSSTKIATVDMKKLFNGYYKTKLAQTSLETRKTELRKEIKDMTDGLEKAQTDYKTLLDQANDQAISADERDKRKQAAEDKAKEINTSRGAIEQFQRQAEAQLADQSQRMSANLVSEIQKAVADKAKAGGYSVVLNAGANEVVVFASADNDITGPVLSQLNAGAPIDVSAPATGVPLNISTNIP